MKALLYFLLSLFCVQQCAAQNAVVANLRENVAYIGIANPLGILAETYRWNEINVSTDNGKIEKDGGGDQYVYYPENAGPATIILKSKKGKIIGRAHFRVKFLPDPVAELGGKNKGIIEKNRLMVYQGIIATLKGFDIEVRYKIQTFSVAIIRNDSTVFVKQDYDGPLFPDALQQEFKKTGHGDKLIFYGITAKGPDKRTMELPPMEFTITKK